MSDPRLGKPLEEITDTPALLVDLDVLEANIGALQTYCDAHAIALWPHAKTHKSAWIAARQLARGAHGLTCAKATEVEQLLSSGVERVLLAYPLIGDVKWSRAASLAGRCELSIMLDSFAAAEGLSDAARRAGVTIDVLVELDAGLGRVGVTSVDAAVTLAHQIDGLANLRLSGLGCYPGHLREASEIDVGLPVMEALLADAVARFDAAGLCRDRVSSGSTLTALRLHECPSVNESRAGTYVLGDRSDDPPSGFALTVLATVVSSRSSGVVIDSGAKTLSADVHLRVGGRGFGEILDEQGQRLSALFDEHGLVAVDDEARRPQLGERVRVVPNHCVAVMNLHDEFLLVSGGTVVDVVPIEARGAVR